LSVSAEKKSGDGGVHYRIAAEPAGARVTVPAIDMTAEGVTGKIVVEDGVITLGGVSGRFAGGTIRTDAELDFVKSPSELRFKSVAVDGLDVHQLPKSWNVP